MGNPVCIILTTGQASEYGQANALTEGFCANYIAADKGYDSDAFIEVIRGGGAEPVIPSRRGQIYPRSYGCEQYKERNLVERLFQKLNNCRRVATRYERLARNYLSMIHLVAAVIWLA